MCKRDYIWNPAACSCENDKCVGSIIEGSVIRCDEIIEEAKTVPTKTFPTKSISTKNIPAKSTIFIFYLPFY